MPYFALLPIAAAVFVAMAQLGVTLLVERAEHQRRLRHPARRRDPFRPRLIQGGKAQAPPVRADARGSKTG